MFALDTWLITLGVALIFLRPHDWQQIMYALGKWVNHIGLPLKYGMENSMKDVVGEKVGFISKLLQNHPIPQAYDYDGDNMHDVYPEHCFDHDIPYVWPMSNDLHLRTIPMPCVK